MKTCKACGETKEFSQFYAHSGMKDGFLNKCKICYCGQVRKHRRENDHVREGDRERYLRKDKSLLAAISRANELKHPIRYRARTILNNAVGDGKIIKPSVCSECGEGGMIHGHHDDYSKPLDVRWLCAKCHSRWHAANGEGLNG